VSMSGMAYWGVTYWSCKADITEITSARYSSQSWFFRYWSNANIFYIDGPWTSWILLAMFVIQTLALAFGCASLVTNRRIILFVPVCLSSTVLALMSYVGCRLANYYGYSSQYGFGYGRGYQLGYYLVYPSVAMFLFVFLLNEVTKKKQATKAAEEDRTILSSSVNLRATSRGSPESIPSRAPELHHNLHVNA